MTSLNHMPLVSDTPPEEFCGKIQASPVGGVSSGMKTIIYATAFMMLLVSQAMAKRIAPAEVPPVRTAEAVYSVPHFPKGDRKQNGGVIEAHHPQTGKLLWRVQVYRIKYDEDLEGDVQDVFIKSLVFDKKHKLLIMADERSRIFVLNLENRKVTRIE